MIKAVMPFQTRETFLAVAIRIGGISQVYANEWRYVLSTYFISAMLAKVMCVVTVPLPLAS
jgi:hypothetical protein